MYYITGISVVIYLLTLGSCDATNLDQRTRYLTAEKEATEKYFVNNFVPCDADDVVNFVSLNVDKFPVDHEKRDGRSEGFNFTLGFTPSSTQVGLKLEVDAFVEGSTSPLVLQSIDYNEAFNSSTTYILSSSIVVGATVPAGVRRLRWNLKSLDNKSLLCRESAEAAVLAPNAGTSINDPCSILNVPCSFPNSNCNPGGGGKCSCNAASVNVQGSCKKTIGTYCLTSSDECIDNASCKRLSGNVVNVCDCNAGYTIKDTTDVCYKGAAGSVLAAASKLMLLVLSFVVAVLKV